MKRHVLGLLGIAAIGILGQTSDKLEPTAQAETGDGVPKRPTLSSAMAETAGGALASLGAKATATPQVSDERTTGACAAGMVEVEGDYCPWLEQTCLRWLDPDMKMRCAEFAPTTKCQSKTTHKHFCMDRYEYPNVVGEKPVIMKTWYEARDACQAQGKRLCGESEWTLACEGQERLPYPYGHVRNAEACNIDKPHPEVNEKALGNPATRDAEAARLWQGEPSGSRESCVSPFGVHDMTGNVDEWVVNESGYPYKSALKGGYWGPVRTRCRPVTTAHNEVFSFYQIGFRCCADAPGASAQKAPAAAPSPGAGASVKPAPAGSPVPATPAGGPAGV
ncbi:MAG: SUMF1/EgtB/PvdO family nonheme iron enzyme [Myxococcales bacterium]|jgi:hypothetical protein|nr:SUMF1/EgtB/PvdO family nonheme iron enzyme [Myxococcales bacterium]